MSDSVTPPRPTAPTAAELRERFADEWNTREHWDSGGVRMGADLDDLMAAVRAEALEEQAQALEDDGIAMPEGDVQAALARHCRRMRGLARALVSK